MFNDGTIKITLDTHDLLAINEALYESVANKLAMMMRPEYSYVRDAVTWPVFRHDFEWKLNAYTKVMLTIKTVIADEPAKDKFIESVSFPPEVWEWLNQMSDADSWDEFPFHEFHPPNECKVCEVFIRANA